MSTVYLARDQAARDALVAVKVLNTDHPEEIKQEVFKRETAGLKRLKHPNIVRLEQSGISEEDGQVYLFLGCLPCRKNDRERIEQKNGLVVRRFTGHHRDSVKMA